MDIDEPAPYVERLRGNHTLSSGLIGITAAVVGVIANLAIYFAVHTLFEDVTTTDWGLLHLQLPDLTTLKPVSLGIAVVAAILLFRGSGLCSAPSASAPCSGLSPAPWERSQPDSARDGSRPRVLRTLS